MWLNNCIGATNYRYFFITVASVGVMTGILLASTFYLLYEYFFGEESFHERIPDVLFSWVQTTGWWAKAVPQEVTLAVIIWLIFINGPFFALDMQLVLLHCFLMTHNMTTYDYIKNKRDRQKGGDETRGRPMNPCIHRCMERMDWIIFCRCGKRHRKRRAQIQETAMSSPLKPDAIGAPDDDGLNDSPENCSGASPERKAAMEDEREAGKHEFAPLRDGEKINGRTNGSGLPTNAKKDSSGVDRGQVVDIQASPVLEPLELRRGGLDMSEITVDFQAERRPADTDELMDAALRQAEERANIETNKVEIEVSTDDASHPREVCVSTADDPEDMLRPHASSAHPPLSTCRADDEISEPESSTVNRKGVELATADESACGPTGCGWNLLIELMHWPADPPVRRRR